MPSATGQSWEKYKKEFADDEEPEKKITPLTDESVHEGTPLRYGADSAVIRDIQVLKTYGAAPYAAALKRLEKQIKERQTSVNEKIGQSAVLCRNLITLRLTMILGVKVEQIQKGESGSF